MSIRLPVTNGERARQAFALLQNGQSKQAERILKDVLRAEPNQHDALVGMGVLNGMRGRDTDAVQYLSRAAMREPRSDMAQYNLGLALMRLGRHAEAVAAFAAAAAVADLAHVHEKLADSLRNPGRLDEAVASYRRAAHLSGARAGGMLLSSLVETQRRICDWTGLTQAQARLIEFVKRGEPVEPLLLNYLSDDPDLLKRNAVAYATGFLPKFVSPDLERLRLQHPRRDRERIRIGYLCSDFRQHATAHLMADMFGCHDRARFETYALSFGIDDKSAMRKRLESAFERFVDLSGAADLAIAKRIHTLGIDILVDLNGYIANARPGILMARPAPIQCHWLAFPGTLGGNAIDYMLVDPVVAPPGSDAAFTEKLVRLPDSYQPNDRKRQAGPPPSREACGLPAHGTVLASFNNSIKLSPDTFDSWMRILAAVPDSVLWLYADNDWTADNLQRAAIAAGIAPERLIFARYASSDAHLARLANADLVLDSFPYGAHTTASDALWMGVPVLTRSGRSFASLVCASLLGAIGLPELITGDAAAYEREAISLARDPSRIAALKSRLGEMRDKARLFDTPRLARHVEAAFEQMWERWHDGLPPAALDVAAG